jgi:hypothetical protein
LAQANGGLVVAQQQTHLGRADLPKVDNVLVRVCALDCLERISKS